MSSSIFNIQRLGFRYLYTYTYVCTYTYIHTYICVCETNIVAFLLWMLSCMLLIERYQIGSLILVELSIEQLGNLRNLYCFEYIIMQLMCVYFVCVYGFRERERNIQHGQEGCYGQIYRDTPLYRAFQIPNGKLICKIRN